MPLADKVRVKREEKRWTQARLARESGLTQATISRIESGEVLQLKSGAMQALAGALDVSVNFLVGEKSTMEFGETLEADETARVIFRGYEKLTSERKRQLKEFVEFLLKQERSGKR